MISNAPSLSAELRNRSTPFEPRPTGLEPSIAPLPGIRALICDVYGTLFASAAGGLDTSLDIEADPAADLIREHGIPIPESLNLSRNLQQRIRNSHNHARAQGVDYPEVEIRQLWREVLENHGIRLTPEELENFALRYEIAVNPVWPMPGLGSLLTSLKASPLILGLLSNAQFFTPLLFDAFLISPHDRLGFQPDLCFWSYEHQYAKPSHMLFARVSAALAYRGIAPSETAYIGNDIRNDIMPAAALGFKTILFAGDQRSLRLRMDEPNRVAPDRVITHLDQLPEILDIVTG